MSTSWLFRTRQMSEAGKEILLREALVTHMRSPRDRQMLTQILSDKKPLEDILSFFAAFYLYNYQGLSLLRPQVEDGVPTDKAGETSQEERRLLELEVRQLMGGRERQELQTVQLAAEFMIALCDLVLGKSRSTQDLTPEVRRLLEQHINQMPTDYSPNMTADFLNVVTGWGDACRKELYVKASGLKESSLTLREEMLREHEAEAIETTALNRTISSVMGSFTHLPRVYRAADFEPAFLDSATKAILDRIPKEPRSLKALRGANDLKLVLVQSTAAAIGLPTTLEELEDRLVQIAGERGATIIEQDPGLTYEFLAAFLGIPVDEVRGTLKGRGVDDPVAFAKSLRSTAEESVHEHEGPTYSKEELDTLEKSAKALDKLELTLEKSVKGLLRSRGLRSSELDKISVEFLTKPRGSLIAIEQQVLDELQKKARVPPPEEMEQLLKTRALFKEPAKGEGTGLSVSQMSQQRHSVETGSSVKKDLVWHFALSIITNLTRVVETYIRSKQDLLRIRALLKSLYEDTESEFQFVREEILVDLMSNRINEMKCVHPELDAETICGWMHARLSSMALDTARAEIRSSTSPVFDGISDAALKLDGLTFDNYAIAFDVMQRFLERTHQAMEVREKVATESRLEKERALETRKKGFDALLFIYTKAHTVFKAIGRVGSKGLEWSPNDDAKCANLLSFYVQNNRGRPVCQICGETPSNGICPTHGKGHINSSNDLDNLAVFIMRAISDIKSGLLGPTAKPFAWDEARALVQRQLASLRRSGKLTSRTNIKELIQGEINYVVGPAIAEVIGGYFNESLQYAARRVDLA